MTDFETEIEDQLDDADAVVPLKYDITSYGADYSVDLLVTRLQRRDILIPQFQRGFVWQFTQASRFIESLLLGLPVPGIFLSKEFATQELVVIDGQQRLRTLQFFYEGIWEPTGGQFALRGVQGQFAGYTYKNLRSEDRRRLDNSIIHATIVQQDSPPEDDSSIYYIFERINTRGTPLSPQEVRSCIYHGQLNDLLKSLNEYENWRSVYGSVNKRMRDQELILRFLALYFYTPQYKRPMREFLNKYMVSNRKLQRQSADQLSKIFQSAIDVVAKFLGSQAFRPTRALNAAVYDSIMCAIANRLEAGPIIDKSRFLECYHQLLSDQDFITATTKSTADETSVEKRLKKARNAFKDT